LSETPGSPRASRLATPGWLDGRLVLGVLLVLVSVVVGARVLSAADRSTLVYALQADMAAGSEVLPEDVRPVRVRLFDNAEEYLSAELPLPPGYVLRRAVGAGELLPREAVAPTGAEVDYRVVSVAVEPGHYPSSLDPRQQVDVWVTPDLDGQQDAPQEGEVPEEGAPAPATGEELELRGAQLVLQGVTVFGITREGGFGGSVAVPVELQVAPRDVAKLVSAMALGTIDLVRVPRQAEGSGRLEPAGAG
jgi:hypothetical protein